MGALCTFHTRYIKSRTRCILVFTKASFVFLAFTHTVQSIHARGTDRSVLGVRKQQYHVVISRPIDDIGFKLCVSENANTVACNGSHLHIVPLRG